MCKRGGSHTSETQALNPYSPHTITCCYPWVQHYRVLVSFRHYALGQGCMEECGV